MVNAIISRYPFILYRRTNETTLYSINPYTSKSQKAGAIGKPNNKTSIKGKGGNQFAAPDKQTGKNRNQNRNVNANANGRGTPKTKGLGGIRQVRKGAIQKKSASKAPVLAIARLAPKRNRVAIRAKVTVGPKTMLKSNPSQNNSKNNRMKSPGKPKGKGVPLGSRFDSLQKDGGSGPGKKKKVNKFGLVLP